MANISEKPVSGRKPGKIVLYHVPVIMALLIIACFVAIDYPPFARFRTEETFAMMLVVGIPLAILLGITQLFLWLRWLTGRASQRTKAIVFSGLGIIAALYIVFTALRYLS
jgi:hypothetical protein